MSGVGRKTTNRGKFDELEDSKAERLQNGPSVSGWLATYVDAEYNLGAAMNPDDVQGTVKDPVLGKHDPTGALPANPVDGDRWMSTAAANGWNNNSLYEYQNEAWLETVPSNGMMTFVLSLGEYEYWATVIWQSLTSGGVTLHAALAGLLADDHTQYHNDARGDVRYYVKNSFLPASAGVGSAGTPIKLDARGRLDPTFYAQMDIVHADITGVGASTHGQIDSHISEMDIHFTEASIIHVNISGLNADDHTQYTRADGTRAFSAAVAGQVPTLGAHLATKDYVDLVASSIIPIDPVLDFFDPTVALPVGPSLGDRHISSATANGWTADNVYEYNGATWDETVAVAGMVTDVISEGVAHLFTGVEWTHFGSVSNHSLLSNLGADDHTQYHNNTRGDIRYFQKAEFLAASAGAGDSGKPIKLNGGGQLDMSFIDPTDIIHQSISGAGSHTHVEIDSHIDGAAVHYTEASIVHQNISGVGSKTHTELDTHVNDATLHYTEASIVHQNISGAGAYTHTNIDSHINNTSNPHSVTKTQVVLGSVTDDAQLKRTAADFSSFDLKGTPAYSDVLLIEDAADTENKKYATLGTLPSRGLDGFTAMQEPTGFPNRTDSTYSFTDGTLTFEISPAVTSFDIWIAGLAYTKSVQQSVVITNTEGTWYFYFDAADQVLKTTQIWTDDLILKHVFVAALYWDAANEEAIYVGEERHGLTQDGPSHLQDHLAIGAIYRAPGLDPTNISANASGALDSSAQLSYNGGQIRDEDIQLSVVTAANPASFPVFYKTGASALWRRQAASTFPVISGGSGRLAYNEFTGGAWQQTDVSNNDFVLAHFFVMNDADQLVIAVQGQSAYGNIAAAREGANTEMAALSLAGLPFVEFVALWTVIYQTANGYANAPKAIVRTNDLGEDYTDFRGTTISTGAGSGVPSHSILPDLEVDDHLQYYNQARIEAWRNTWKRFEFTASALDSPASADWAVNVLAPVAADSNNSGASCRLFDDTTEEGVGTGAIVVPPGAVNVTISLVSRAETAPGGVVGVRPKLYVREFPDNAAPEAWDAGTLMAVLAIPTNEHWQYDTEVITLASLGLVAGQLAQFELTRASVDASDTLVGDWTLLQATVEFSE